MLKRMFDLFIFSSVYIALCAVVMVNQTNHLLQLHNRSHLYYLFVFFSTLCSYNLHWYLTPYAENEIIRIKWTHQHKLLHLVLSAVGLVFSLWYFIKLNRYWLWLSIAGLLTFLYTAPKIPIYFLRQLRKVAVGKTIYLAFVWLYVTSCLPLLLSEKLWTGADMLFCISRFFLIYPICILFDYRDRRNDKKEGIRSMIAYLNERGINTLFYSSLVVFFFTTSALFYAGFSLATTLLLLMPGAIVFGLYGTAKRNFSDYLYYFILDGLMMFSALFTSLIQISYF